MGRPVLGTHRDRNTQKAPIGVCLCPSRSLRTYSAKHSMLGADLLSYISRADVSPRVTISD